MSKIYKLGEELLVSKEYVDDVIKESSDNIIIQINNIIEGLEILDRIKPSIVEVDTKVTNLESLLPEATNVVNNDGVSINATTLTSLKEKPTSLEVKQLIEGSKLETIREIETILNNIINTKDAISKIKDLISILDSKDGLSSLNKALNNKISKEEFEKYKTSGAALTNNDRKALNVLLHMAKNGFVDWLAPDGDLNSIKNKPDSLPANGGNAETVMGRTVDELINKSSEDLIIGCKGKKYKESTVDLLFDNNSDSLSRKLEDFDGGIITFKSGKYWAISAKIEAATDEDIIINGSKSSSIIIDSTLNLNYNITLRDMHFSNCTISIFNNCSINNCTFDNCNIILQDASDSIITNNRINGGSISFRGLCMYNMVTNNIIKGTSSPIYIGGSNMFSNNIAPM